MRASPLIFETSPLTQDDCVDFMALARISHEESYYRKYNFNDLYAKNLFDEAVGQQSFGVKLKCGGSMVGYFLGHISTMGFCDMQIGMDDGFYILPPFRRGLAAKSMLDLFFSWCDQNQAMAMALIHFGDDNEKTYNFLMKSGMVERGRLFKRG